MSYNRPPVPGIALKQIPSTVPAGSVLQVLDSNISSTTELGVVQVGSGLTITPQGVLSTTSGSSLLSVKLTSVNYTALAADYYIGATKKDIEITLPLGIIGKVYIIKNQINGNIEVKGSGSQKLDNSSDKNLGSESSIIVVFDGTRWNVI
jgi:hypothetical protein